MLKFWNCFFFGVSASHVADYGFGEEEKNFTGFAKFFDENIRPKALLIEEIRIRDLKRFMLYSRISFVGIAIIWVVAYHIFQNHFFSVRDTIDIVTYAMGATGLCFLLPYSVIKKFSLEIKKNLFEDVFRFCNLDYIPEGSKAISHYRPFNITPDYKPLISKTEDMVQGQYKNVDFRFEELDLQVEQGSGNRRRSLRTFKGVVVLLKFNKNFSGRTILKSDLGMIRNFSRKMVESRLKDLEKVALEDLEFEKIFEVYSSDQIEARYLLTTSFMERIKKLSNFFYAKKIEASFYNDCLLLQFSSSINLFKVDSIFNQIDIAIESRKVLEQLLLIYDLIDELKLGEKTGL